MAVGGLLRCLSRALLVYLACSPGLAHAQDAPAAEARASAAADASTLEARRHFKAGIKLYRDGNYGGALAEFEEAYRQKRGPGSLQNVALCQKALFRYAEAAGTLEQLIARHAAELSEGERKAVDDALSELRSMVASLKLRVEPESARVLLDGRALSPSDWAQPLVVNVGEHTLTVDAPGFAPERKLLRVAGGQKEVPVHVQLRCVAGFVDVSTNDPTANIAIDGLPKARRAYKGPVEADTDHLLQVYREGVEPFERTFQVGVCKTLAIQADLEGLENAPPATGDAQTLAGAPAKKTQKGWYGLLSLDILGLARQPLSLEISKATGGTLGALGLRAGYRLSNPVALELMLDAGALEVTGALDTQNDVTRDYSLRSIHFGPNLKLMTTDATLRFVTTIGAGIVHHRLEVAANEQFRAAEARGVDPYFLLGLGMGFSFKHFLGEIGLVALIDGTTKLQKGFTDQQNAGLTEELGTTLPMVGLGLRGGFSQWHSGR